MGIQVPKEDFMNRRSFILCSLAGFIGRQQRDLFPDCPDLKRWEHLVQQAEDPDLIARPHMQSRMATRLRRAIAEVDSALQDDPRNADLHLMLVKLHLAGYDDDLFLSERVIRHSRRACVLAPSDPEVLALAGDALSFRGLVHDSIGLWREGVRLLRKAYGLKRTAANQRLFESAVAHCPA
jgi:hypothetical protein